MAGEEEIIPGVYSAVDLASLNKLRDEQQRMIQESKEKAKVWAKQKSDYLDLKQKLSTIADKTTHQVMVPFGGKKAFFEGQLVHTNEVMVLLGDNWFVERSAKEAAEICDRRISRSNDMLQKLDQEIQLFQSWQDESNQLMSDSKLREIREPYNEKDEEEWRKKHREKVKAAKLSQEKNRKSEDEDQEANLWKLLDQLEMEEDMKNELEAFTAAEEEINQRQNTTNNDEHHEDLDHDESSTELEIEETESDLSVSPDVLDDENAMEDIIRERERLREKLTTSSSVQQEENEKRSQVKFTEKTISSSEPPHNKSRFAIRRRAVSFGEVSERLFSQEQDQQSASFSTVTEEAEDVKNVEEGADSTKVIEFDFLGPDIITSNHLSKSCTNTPIHPGDLLRIYGPMKSPTTTTMVLPNEKKKAKKSILKSKSKYGGGSGGGSNSSSSSAMMAAMDASSKGHGNLPQLQSVPSPTMTTRFQTVKAVNDAVVEREVQERPTVVPALTKMPMASKAISDSVVERKPSAFNSSSSNSSSESAALKPAATQQKLSRFRATRVHK